MATATAAKPRSPKAIAVSKLIGGKLVTTLAKSELEKLDRAQALCADLRSINGWEDKATAAHLAIGEFIKLTCGITQ